MITGEIKNQIDQIWDTFFVAGVTNPITVLEQMTYIFFMKMLDDKQLQEEDNARDFDSEVKNPTFPAGQMWLNPDTNQEVPYESMRWSVFRNTGSENMYNMIPFIASMIILAFTSKKSRAPKAEGIPYDKGSR